MQLVTQHTNGWLTLLVFQLPGKAKEHRQVQMHVLLKVSWPSLFQHDVRLFYGSVTLIFTAEH